MKAMNISLMPNALNIFGTMQTRRLGRKPKPVRFPESPSARLRG
jgi:hypothetical protein